MVGPAAEQAQLLAARPDLSVATIRGNVQTRLSRVATGEFSASMLALAGLRRLGLEDAAAAVLDPPFGGAPEQAPLLARARVPRVVYVSCSPAALARDAKPLKDAGYRVVSAVPVDQFLWSPHLEAVVAFSL